MVRFLAGLAFAVVVVTAPGCSSTRCDPCTQYRSQCGSRCERVVARDCDCDVVSNRSCGGFCDLHTKTVGYTAPYYDAGPQSRSRIETATYTASHLRNTEAEFVREAAMANTAEIRLGRLAVRNGSTNDIRNFGQEMITSHGRALNDLERTASAMGYLVPGEMDPEHGRIASSCSVLSGSDFDRRFVDQMVIDHRETISLFEARAATTPQNEIQEYAARTLPHLRHHLQKAEELQSQLRK